MILKRHCREIYFCFLKTFFLSAPVYKSYSYWSEVKATVVHLLTNLLAVAVSFFSFQKCCHSLEFIFFVLSSLLEFNSKTFSCKVFIELRTGKLYGDLSSITLPAEHVPLEARPLTKPAVNTAAYFSFSTACFNLAAPVPRLYSPFQK